MSPDSDLARPPSQDMAESKARKACINCRRQKMKCRIDSGSVCRRCERSGVPCIFVPRANAAQVILPAPVTDPASVEFSRDVLRRLKTIEDYLGLPRADEHTDSDSTISRVDALVDALVEEDMSDDLRASRSLWDALACLQRITPAGAVNPAIWRKSTIKHLWLTFHDTMPGFHFLPKRQTFSSPRPLLLASILWCSSSRGAPQLAELAPYYLAVLFNAIGQLSIPNSELVQPANDPYLSEEWAFQTVLGLVLAGLLMEANVRETGVWISIAYRLILEHCPPHIDENLRDWRKLFTGVQIVDLEHASIHLSCPVIPLEPPLSMLQVSHRDQLYRLSRMMHTGLTHFTGRGLPTIWSCFTKSPGETATRTLPFTAIDAAILRDWARQLDEWLVEFSKAEHDTEEDRTPVFRQYVLHRLMVLSIYHPARGCNLYSNSITPEEQYELLLSARATLKLHLNDNSIWSNWDLVMITWAALIVIQGVDGGSGEPDDLQNIRIHLDKLRHTNEPKPSLRDRLITRLEHSLQNVQTPSPSSFQDHISLQVMSRNIDYSWQIFDQASLEPLGLVQPLQLNSG